MAFIQAIFTIIETQSPRTPRHLVQLSESQLLVKKVKLSSPTIFALSLNGLKSVQFNLVAQVCILSYIFFNPRILFNLCWVFRLLKVPSFLASWVCGSEILVGFRAKFCGSGSPPITKPPISSHFNLDEWHMLSTKSNGKK